mmetsp:Transcript_89376/g.253248  ORF Transcript_89376/g.253248 Transcript_89376/m.253248 type:complete len:375 (-) Transcript_89376:150-1274(-)
MCRTSRSMLEVRIAWHACRSEASCSHAASHWGSALRAQHISLTRAEARWSSASGSAIRSTSRRRAAASGVPLCERSSFASCGVGTTSRTCSIWSVLMSGFSQISPLRSCASVCVDTGSRLSTIAVFRARSSLSTFTPSAFFCALFSRLLDFASRAATLVLSPLKTRWRASSSIFTALPLKTVPSASAMSSGCQYNFLRKGAADSSPAWAPPGRDPGGALPAALPAALLAAFGGGHPLPLPPALPAGAAGGLPLPFAGGGAFPLPAPLHVGAGGGALPLSSLGSGAATSPLGRSPVSCPSGPGALGSLLPTPLGGGGGGAVGPLPLPLPLPLPFVVPWDAAVASLGIAAAASVPTVLVAGTAASLLDSSAVPSTS